MMTRNQLSLFDTTAVIQTTYKVGDQVKLKRKTPHAACLKKGDIIQIEAIHPRDGSCKFWNERTESWGYVYPDDFTLVLSPKNNSVTLVVETVAVIESIVETVAVTESIVETVAVTESIVETVAVIESIVETVAVIESIVETVAVTESIVETVAVTESIDSVTKAISTYRPRGTARSGEYFRFSYRDGSKIRHIHIRGGNTGSPISQAKVQEVRSALAAGISPVQVAITILGRHN